jgi:ABC-type sugar transport system permease subunit
VIVLLPWAVSEYATATTWRYIYSSEIGMINALLFRLGITQNYLEILTAEHAIDFVAIAYAWHFTPLIAFFLLAGLQTIPEDYYKAAKIDGAGAIRRFIHITFPHLRFAVLIGLILATMEAARAFDIIFMLTSGGPGSATSTVTYDIYLTTFAELNLGLGAAKSYLLIILILFFAVVYFRVLTRKKKVE